MKKVLIVTLEQGGNYGGMLQAYALQCTLGFMGIEAASTYSTQQNEFRRRLLYTTPVLYRIAVKLRGGGYDKERAMLYTRGFVEKNIQMTDFRGAKNTSYDAYVVGSDQVWRKPYTYVPHNLLSFVKNHDAPRISYAASFGKDNLDEYGDKLIAKTKKLARKFDAISVREDTGVDVAQKYWGVKAEHHVDPTLLLNAADYEKLVKEETLELVESDGDLFAYVLDVAPEKQGVIQVAEKAMKLKPFTVIDGDENDGKPMPPVTQWLKSFMDAKYVVTDSFHGAVFSIIFNKPFIAIGNKDRGLARFSSLLKIFELEDRLISDVSEVTPELINAKIDWKKVNAIKAREQKRSMEYLRKYLG